MSKYFDCDTPCYSYMFIFVNAILCVFTLTVQKVVYCTIKF